MSEVQLLERGPRGALAALPRPASAGFVPDDKDVTPEPGKRRKVSLDDDVLTIVASLKMAELPALKKKIEALEAFYNAE